MSRRTPVPAGSPPDLSAFLAAHSRLPRLGDTPAPWHFRGWLLPYVLELHALVPAVGNRWGYLLRTLEAGRLLDEPIPQIVFGPAQNKVFALLNDWSRLIGRDCGGWSDFRILMDWLAWALALSDEEPSLSEAVNEKLYRQVDLTPLLEQPHDYLGEHVATSRAKGWNPTGFYPTPHPVVECMVRMMLCAADKDGRDPRTYQVADPCVGSGRMLLHASSFSLNLFGQDIDPLVVVLCKINGALYAPWLSFPISDAILGVQTESLTASLPAPPPVGVPVFRVDDRRQGLLFDL